MEIKFLMFVTLALDGCHKATFRSSDPTVRDRTFGTVMWKAG